MNNTKWLRALAILSYIGAMNIACAVVSAQSSRSADSIVGTTNSVFGFGIHALVEDSNSDGSPTSAAITQSFTGKDGNGATKTMSFTGETQNSSQFGQLHAFAKGTVSNTYYNVDNPAYADLHTDDVNPNGSPDGLVSLGFSIFTDTLQYGGTFQAGYKARYIFHVDGTNTGYGVLADLSVTIANDAPENFFTPDQQGFFSDNWATTSHDVAGNFAQTVGVQFSNQFVVNTFDVADGSNVSGTSDFTSTVTLAEIDVVDANDNPVTGVTITSASGTQYPVPEPTITGLLGITAILMQHRKRSR